MTILTSEAFSVSIVGDSALASAAAALGVGQSVQFTKNTLQSQWDIQWQNESIFYDATRQELQYMGKPASSQSLNHSHYIYSENTDSWATTGQSLFPGSGHIWYPAFDTDNGDYFYRRNQTDLVRWFDRSDGSNGIWKATPSQTNPALSAGNDNLAAMGWHPNLFGSGNPGLFLWSPFRFFGFNLTSQSWSVLQPSNFSQGTSLWNRSTGQALYLPGTDQLICFAADRGNGDPALTVDAGAGNSSDIIGDSLAREINDPPINIKGGGGSEVHGHVINHPNDEDRLLIFDEHSTGRVWDSTDQGSSWSLKTYSHPFTGMPSASSGEYTVGTGPYGVVIAMSSTSSGGETILWKPND